MPVQPPRFGRSQQRRSPWLQAAGQADRRLRGRAGVRLRQQVRDEEPFCRLCLADGRYSRTDEVDHIRPLSEGGDDSRANLQGLCLPCHETKSKAERAAERQYRDAR